VEQVGLFFDNDGNLDGVGIGSPSAGLGINYDDKNTLKLPPITSKGKLPCP